MVKSLLVAALLHYVIKTDLKEGEADTCLVHGWHKDFMAVEKVFGEQDSES